MRSSSDIVDVVVDDGVVERLRLWCCLFRPSGLPPPFVSNADDGLCTLDSEQAESNNNSMSEITALSFVDVQHDAVAVFDDVAQNTVQAENVWVSAVSLGVPTNKQYREHADSVHGKLRVERDAGRAVITSSGGVDVVRNGVGAVTAPLTPEHTVRLRSVTGHRQAASTVSSADTRRA